MRLQFLADHCVPTLVIESLQAAGHEVSGFACIETRRSLLLERLGPISVVRERLLPNGSGAGAPDL